MSKYRTNSQPKNSLKIQSGSTYGKEFYYRNWGVIERGNRFRSFIYLAIRARKKKKKKKDEAAPSSTSQSLHFRKIMR